MNVRYHTFARKEIIETTAHYGRVRPKLGFEFLAELNTAIESIAANPLLSSKFAPAFDVVSSRDFRTASITAPDANTVRIILVRHHSRHPGYGMRRK